MIHSARILKSLALLGLVALAFGLLARCTPEYEVFTEDPNAPLLVSRDTVLFDTLFSTLGSTTRRLKLLNPNANAIAIDRIGLGGGSDSPFRLVVNGEPGIDFTDEVLLGGDSLLMLVEVTIDPQDQNLPFLVQDSIVVSWNGNEDQVKLLAWGQDAHFLGGVELFGEHTWSPGRPYVLYDIVLVDSFATLTIEPGTQIYSGTDAVLGIEGTLNVKGDSANRVLFRHSRLQSEFDDVAGQWGGIYFLQGSTGNSIAYTDIWNAEYGVYVGTPDNDTLPDVTLAHTRIRNASLSGLIAFTSDVYAYNCEISNCQQFVVGNLAGGSYRYDHCTFVNFDNFIRNYPAVLFADNVILANDQILAEPLYVQMRNCIVWGSEEEELLLDNAAGQPFTVDTQHVIVRALEGSLSTGTEIRYNEDPLFVDEFTMDLRIQPFSPARDAGLDLGIGTDVLGGPRDAAPDMGAHEYRGG